MKSLTFKDFKKKIKEEKLNKKDFLDFEHGKIMIHRCNLNYYLEKYACKNYEDLSDTMWYTFGCLVNFID